MRTTTIGILATACALASPLAAQTPPTPPSAPTDAPAPADPARQAAADRAVAMLVPEGIYARMMRDQFPKMMDVMSEQMMGMKASDFGGKGDETLAQSAAAKDPHYRERMRIMSRVMSEEMGVVMARMEPRVRAGLGRAFARKFTTAQLGDMNAFFATPSGKAFAGEFLMLFVDPEMMREMATMTPEMIRAMPAIIAKVEAATRHLPPPPKSDTPDAGESGANDSEDDE